MANWKGSMDGLSTDEPRRLFIFSPARLLGIGTAAISMGGGAEAALSARGSETGTDARGVKPWKLAKFQFGCVSEIDPYCLGKTCMVACWTAFGVVSLPNVKVGCHPALAGLYAGNAAGGAVGDNGSGPSICRSPGSRRTPAKL